MRYTVYHFDTPFDPRYGALSALDEPAERSVSGPAPCSRRQRLLREVVSSAPSRRGTKTEFFNEQDAARALRERYPDLIAMPVPVDVGSGSIMFLGILPEPRVTNPKEEIPFVALVHAKAEDVHDKKTIAARKQFSREPWRAPVLVPKYGGLIVRKAEVRATGLEVPMIVDVKIGRVGDRLVNYFSFPGTEVSIAFSGASEAPDDEPHVDHSGAVAKEPADIGETSDGYHTFNELYEHRHALFLALCRAHRTGGWCSRVHHDGSSMPGWFIAGISEVSGLTITYHLPDRLWDDAVRTCHVLERAPEWDGHTSKDVIERIKQMA